MSGFAPVGTTDGSDYHGKLQDVIIDDAVAAFVGDITIAGTQVATDEVPRVEAQQAVTDDSFGGVLVEIYPDFTDEGSLITNYVPAGAGDRGGRVAVGNEVVYVGEDSIGGIDGTDIGSSFLTALAAGDVITGVSGQTISNTAGVAGDVGITILGLQQKVGNEYGVGAKLLCTIGVV